ncbi:hypothetical protein FS749_004843 [Ceratobasidium sp. UAMH 11750]|nr:hypothetical protein FS749_004843 [Ceratobasidium sp. UAMH 11750]
MIKFIQRQEAVWIHQAHLDAWLALIQRKLAVVKGEGDASNDGGEYDEDDWEDVDRLEEQPDASATHYLTARLAIAVSLTRANLSANRIVAMYKATDLIPALNRFLESTVATAHGRSHLPPGSSFFSTPSTDEM